MKKIKKQKLVTFLSWCQPHDPLSFYVLASSWLPRARGLYTEQVTNGSLDAGLQCTFDHLNA